MENEDRQTLEYIAKSINYVTPFSGDKFSLSSFINRIESLIPIIELLNNEHKIIVLGYITDKIIGKAKETLVRNGPVTTWTELKRVLIKNHGERTTIPDLIDEMKLCRCDSTIEIFYNKIISLLSKINNAYILNGEANADQIASNHRLALKHFRENLPPLAKNLVGCRNPQTLDDAYDLLTQFGYLSLIHDKPKPMQNKNPSFNNRSPNYRSNQRNYNSSNRIENSNINHEQNQRNNNNFYRRDNPNSSTQRNQLLNNNSNNQQNRSVPQRNNPTTYPNSGQSRNSNNNYYYNRPNPQKNPQNNNEVEPMDISVNEDNNSVENPQLQQNFQETGRNNYLI